MIDDAAAVAEYVLNTEAHPLPVFMPNHPLADFWSIIMCKFSKSESKLERLARKSLLHLEI